MRQWLALAALACMGATDPASPAVDPQLTAVVTSLPRYEPAERVSGTISVWGHGSPKHDFVGDLVRRWFAEFNRIHPDVRLDYRMYGTASAVSALATNAGTLAILGEEISPDSERMFRRAKGYAPTIIEIANGSVDTNYFDYAHMVFVHRDNPLAGLTASQLAGIFGAANRCGRGDIRKWNQLGMKGMGAGHDIVPYVWKTDVDFALFFRERILCGDHRWNPAVREFMPVTQADGSVVQHGQLILEALARDPDGIAISNVRFANPMVRALPLSWSPRRGFTAATNGSLIDRSYPLGRIIPAVVDLPPGKRLRPAEREFLRYILSREGQRALVESSGYLPLGLPTLMRERAKLK